MKNFLNSNIFLIAFLVIMICYFISFISNNLVLSDRIYEKYLDERYETKYNEYKDLDIDLSEFEDELAQFEQSAEQIAEDSSYDWGTFYVDSLYVLIPLLLITFGFSSTYLILILFHKQLHIIKYLDILKATLTAFLVFYLPEIISAIYFLLFKKSYELKDIHGFESYFKLDKLFDKDNTQKWLWNIASEIGFVYLLFPLIVGLLLSVIYKNFRKGTLIGYSYLAYFIIFVFYSTLSWYLFGLT